MRRKIFSVAILSMAMLFSTTSSEACTNVLVTKGASKDGSTMVTYTADSHALYGQLYFRPAATYPAGTMMKIYEWDTGKYLGEIPQVLKTYSVMGNMNEYQLCIAESTYGGREELADSTGLIDYGTLIYTTLQRAKTAREAINVIGDLVAKYGYFSSGESLSISDPNEVWILEIIGKGVKLDKKGNNVNKGAVWVAQRVPDGYICAHANHARITTFPLNDPENCIYAPDVISFARQAGYYPKDKKTAKDANFSFSDTYAPIDVSGARGCEARVWAIFRNAKSTTDMDQYLDYAMGKNLKNRMPLWVKPAEKLSVKDVANLMRDHYDGTPMDMHNDTGAGGHNCPIRWRPMNFTVDGVEYLNERAVATQQTGFWFLAQGRSWLPNAIGGINWFGVDDTSLSTLTPIYSSSTRVPECLREGNGHMTKYSPTAMFWIVNRVTNFAYGNRWDMIDKDVHKVIDRFDNKCYAEIPQVDAKAKALYEKNPAEAIAFLTDFSVNTAQSLFDEWVVLDQYLFMKYKDGNVMKEKDGKFEDNGNGRNIPAFPLQPGYNENWKRAVANDKDAERLKVIK